MLLWRVRNEMGTRSFDRFISLSMFLISSAHVSVFFLLFAKLVSPLLVGYKGMGGFVVDVC